VLTETPNRPAADRAESRAYAEKAGISDDAIAPDVFTRE
jgi:hypothetical protein